MGLCEYENLRQWQYAYLGSVSEIRCIKRIDIFILFICQQQWFWQRIIDLTIRVLFPQGIIINVAAEF